MHNDVMHNNVMHDDIRTSHAPSLLPFEHPKVNVLQRVAVCFSVLHRVAESRMPDDTRTLHAPFLLPLEHLKMNVPSVLECVLSVLECVGECWSVLHKSDARQHTYLARYLPTIVCVWGCYD